MPKNIELKAACSPDQREKIEQRLSTRSLAADDVLIQVDTYFRVNAGRLKLREISSERGQSAELIQYDRPDDGGARLSTYRILALDPDQAETLDSLLRSSLGVLVIVRKRRRVAIRGATRIHLDEVDGLGSFVELETVLRDDDSDGADGRAEYNEVVAWLGLAKLPSVAGSYSDLIIQKGP